MAGTIQKQLLGAVLALAAMGACSAPALAADIRYAVNQVADKASVTGYITTDGTLGAIGPAHIIDWQLFLNDGSNSDPLSSIGKFTLLPSSSQVAGFSAFTATPTALLFDFDGEGGALFQEPVIGSSINYLAFDSSVGGTGGAYSAIDWRVNGALISIHYTGSPPVALAVPEPSTYAMLLAGLVMLALPLRRQKRAELLG
jgi:hypothetical protein